MARDCIADRLKRPAHATMNKIFIHDLRLDTKVGVYEWERKLAQTVRIDVDIGLPSSRPFETGELADAIDYAAVVARIRAFGASHDHALLERFAEALAASCSTSSALSRSSCASRNSARCPACARSVLRSSAKPACRGPPPGRERHARLE